MKILIDTDWFSAIQDLQPSKQKEVLLAILNYPNGHSDTNLWKKTILPNLEKGEIAYFNKLQNLKQNNPQKSNKKNTGSVSESGTDTATVSDTDTTIREDKSNNNSRNNINNNISTTRVNNQSRSNLVNSGQTGQSGQKNQNIQNNQKNQIDNQIEKTRVHNALEIFGNSFKATDAVVGVFDKPDGTTHEGIRIKNPRLMAFVRQRFDKDVLSKVSDWAIDHNQRGHTYNATSLLKLLCKFQSNVEPTINFNSVQAEYLTFEYKQPQK